MVKGSRQAGDEHTGVPQIEVTPEMLEAGFRVLSASGLADEYLEADKLVLSEIFQAMWSALASSPGHLVRQEKST